MKAEGNPLTVSLREILLGGPHIHVLVCSPHRASHDNKNNGIRRAHVTFYKYDMSRYHMDLAQSMV